MTGFETHAVHPLTQGQRAVLARCRDAAQHEVMQITIEGDRFAARRMRAAWDAVAATEAVLSSRLATADGDVVRVVDGRAALPWEEHDWRAAGADAPDRVAAFLEADRRSRFDLEAGPLHRLALLRLPADRAVLVWTVHGVLLDEPSAEALLGRVFAAYAGRSDAPPAQDAAAVGGTAGPHVARPEEPAPAAVRAVERALRVETTRQLVRLSQALGVSMSTLFEAAWAAVLADAGTDAARFHVLRTRPFPGRPGQRAEVRGVALPPAGGAPPAAWLRIAHDALGAAGPARTDVRDEADSLVAFRNTCIGETFASIVPPGWAFHVWSCFAFPRVLEVRGRSPVTLRLQYDAGAMTDADAAAALERMDDLLSGYTSRPDSDHAASTRKSAAHAAA